MFAYAPKGIVLWPVDLPRTDDEGNPLDDKRMLIRYQRLPSQILTERNARVALALTVRPSDAEALGEARELVREAKARAEENVRLLRQHLLGWRDPDTGESGTFSEDDLAAMFADNPTFTVLLRGLFECSDGARAKNSSPGHAGSAAEAQTSANAGGAAE